MAAANYNEARRRCATRPGFVGAGLSVAGAILLPPLVLGVSLNKQSDFQFGQIAPDQGQSGTLSLPPPMTTPLPGSRVVSH